MKGKASSSENRRHKKTALLFSQGAASVKSKD